MGLQSALRRATSPELVTSSRRVELNTRHGDSRRRHRYPCDIVEDHREQSPWYGDLSQLESDVLRVPNHFGPGFHQLLAECGELPAVNFLGECHSSQTCRPFDQETSHSHAIEKFAPLTRTTGLTRGENERRNELSYHDFNG